MKITQCKYGHYYDKAYFAKCPHCYRKNGGRDDSDVQTELELSGLDTDELEFMDADERREILEEAGLDPDEYDF